MIKINRGPAPAILLDLNRKWQKETQKANQHYQTNQPGTFKFEHYRDILVKNELRLVFTKCAYCEGKYTSTSDGDIEHFRPKGRVIEKNPPTPGYYWLANDWDNLLLSCQHCNQGRIQQLIEHGMAPREAKQGKLDQFPLRPAGVHVNAPGSIATEEAYRLLINPCLDDPKDHFAYDEDHAVMIPKTDMAEKSIEVYALARINLVEYRKETMKFFQAQLVLWHRAVLAHENDPTPENAETLRLNWEQIKTMVHQNAQFSGMNRFILRAFLTKHGLKKSKL